MVLLFGQPCKFLQEIEQRELIFFCLFFVEKAKAKAKSAQAFKGKCYRIRENKKGRLHYAGFIYRNNSYDFF